MKPLRWPGRVLADAGILSMNRRNADFIMRHNKRRLYPLVDNKLLTKQLALDAGLAVPELIGTIATEHDIRQLDTILGRRNSFVVKPAHGAGGNGIMVITGQRNRRFIKASGTLITHDEVGQHVSNILSGMFSLGGMPDTAMIEDRVEFDPVFEEITFQGVPDIRTIVFRGVPVAAMVRLPTRASDGKANLHQGAVGVGVDMRTGLTQRGVCSNDRVVLHPDTGARLSGVQIPGWDTLVHLAARCHDLAPLGYLGVDVVLDRRYGPLVLELNARPGLSIQLANQRGLVPMLQRLDAMSTIPTDAAARVQLGLELLDEQAAG